MSDQFRHIGIIGKHADSSVGDTVLELADYLATRGLDVRLEDATSKLMPPHHYATSTNTELAKDRDLVIVVGGDGTLLHAARTFSDGRVPLLGVNLGRLGFLTDVSCDGMFDSLDQILSGNYEEEERWLLKTIISAGDEIISSTKALNDVVIHKWNSARLIEFETYINGQLVSDQRSDGLVISTPTGSTAYALSGGGPILHPSLNALVLVPICPHTLSNRPIVVDGDSRVEIRILSGHHQFVRITCDGLKRLQPEPGQTIMIQKAERPVRLIHPRGHDHYSILRAKLGWSAHPSR